MDKCDTIQWKCIEDLAKYKEIVEKKWLYKFLIGLNKNLDGMRGRILGTKPLPSLREAFTEVRREEIRLKPMLKPLKLRPETFCPIYPRRQPIKSQAEEGPSLV